jgi:hypothetical protein
MGECIHVFMKKQLFRLMLYQFEMAVYASHKFTASCLSTLR